MKKFFLIFIPIILILTYIFYQNNLLPHPKYTNDDFGIQTYKSINDQDHDGIDDQSDIVQNVRKYIETKPQYKSKYYQGGYPTDHYGVCSDVVAFGLLNAGYDLQILVDQDIRENPQSYQVEHPDKNIDFRRVRNLNVYFKRHALSLTLDIYDLDKWQGGDIVIFKIGGGHLAVIAGPCSVESKEQVIEIAKAAKAAGANLLRGGAFKPRTSPYAFQGMGSAGLDILVAAKEATGLPIVSELMDAEYLDEFIEKVDLIQIGARNMQNFDLLKKVGKATKKPILLKRGLSATFQEWIMSAEYIMASGNPNVILCERGVRTFESYTRNTLDLQAVPVIKELTHLPIIIDPSHAGGKWWLVNPMAKAAVAAGCDGLMIEVHNNPEKALCDGPQSLKPAKFEQLMKELKPIADAVGKEI